MVYADGGGVLLIMLNPASFIVGNLLVVLIEYLYFLRLFKWHNKLELFKKALAINLASFFIGVVLFSLIISTISIFGLELYNEKKLWIGDFLFAMGTGVGANSKFTLLAIIMLPIYYLIIYFITVWIEYKLMKSYSPQITLKRSFIWNFVSYSFLATYGALVLYLHKESEVMFWLLSLSMTISKYISKAF